MKSNTVNYLALLLAITLPCIPERAFDIADGVKNNPATYEAETEAMVTLRRQKNPLSYKEIGKIYGVDPGTAHRRVARYLARKEKGVSA